MATSPAGTANALPSDGSSIIVDFNDASNTRSTNPEYSVSPPDFNAGDGTKHFYYYYSAIQTDTNGDGTFDGVSIDVAGPLPGVGWLFWLQAQITSPLLKVKRSCAGSSNPSNTL